MTRARWHLATASIVLSWLVAAVLVSIFHRYVPAAQWLMVHLLLLGAVTNAILIWSVHFGAALLRLPPPPSRRPEIVRLVVVNVSILGVLFGVVSQNWIVIIAFATGVILSVTAHGLSLLRDSQRALQSRFGATVHYYLLACVWLLLGIGFGVMMSRGSLAPELHSRFVIAHIALNVLGWIGFSVVGTLVTLWPTMLRTQVAPDARRSARLALPVLSGAVAIAVVGTLTDLLIVTASGVFVYLAGLGIASQPMLTELRQRLPQSFAAWSVLAGWSWLLISLVTFLIVLVVSMDIELAVERSGILIGALIVGFVAQVLAGALSYLMPVVIGGGPRLVRWRNSVVDRGAFARVVSTNLALVVWLLPVPSAVKVVTSTVVLVCLALAVVLIARAILPPRGDLETTDAARKVPTDQRRPVAGGAIVGVAVTLLAVAAGVAVDPAALGTTAAATASADSGVPATGQTTTVSVEMRGMRFIPDQISVPAGNALIIDVTNRGEDTHDLVLDTGQRTKRLVPGQSASIDVGVVGRQLDGWCSIAGHRQMGMTLKVVVTGGSSASGSELGELMADGGTHEGMDHSSSGSQGTGAGQDLDLMADPGEAFQVRDPRLAPASNRRVHRIELRVQALEEEVAPGVRQTRWTFGGTAPGPTLRGRIGDKFIVTLINDADIGHSIDFHAGALAPDKPMRTITPGKKLKYTFTATKSGIWLYHCSTMPMSLHIANGMFGAVVIDPPDLEPVENEFLLVQSEAYLGPHGGTANMAAIQEERPDMVVFNGYPNQYDAEPLTVEVGTRTRIWVLAAGPNRGTAFHIVGGQFDTVYKEGAYRLTAGTGGSQVLDLATAQGGFVEFELPEPGNYPFVSHVMVDAERGAHGTLQAIQPSLDSHRP